MGEGVGERELVFVIVGGVPLDIMENMPFFIMVPYSNHVNSIISWCSMNQKIVS